MTSSYSVLVVLHPGFTFEDEEDDDDEDEDEARGYDGDLGLSCL